MSNVVTATDAVSESNAAQPQLGPRIVPASVGQASLWFLRQVMPYKSPYNTTAQLRLTGELDPNVLAACVREIARRHESCRTTLVTVEGAIHQAIWPEMEADVTVVDLAASRDPEAEATRLAYAAAAAPFDLEHGPLLRARILRMGPRDHALVIVMDHIVIDGMSLGIWWREIEALYPALRAGQPSPLPPPRKQFAECVAEQTAWMQTNVFARQLDFWTKHLAGANPCDLPADRPRPPIKSYRGGFVRSRLTRALVDRLRALAASEHVSLFTTLLATLDVLLARYSGQGDISTLIPFAARERYSANDVMGYFANVVVLRTNVGEQLSFRALLKQVGAEVMGGLHRQDVPFERVVGKLRPDRSLSNDPLASVGVSYLPTDSSTLQLPGIEARFEEVPNGGAKFDLQFFIAEVAGELTCCLEYNSDIFDESTIDRLLAHYRVLLEAVVSAPATTVAELPLMSEAERRQIAIGWNATHADYPRSASLPDLVSTAAARTPDAVALSFEGQQLTYAQLERRSNQVARRLRAMGVGGAAGARVGIAVERSLQMVVGMLGIVKAGGAYLPLDPGYPRDRLALMASDSGLQVLVTEERLADIVASPAQLRLDTDAAQIDAESDAPLGLILDPESVAYVIYTSGSTGKPKGVEVPHRALVNFLTSMAERPGLSAADRLLAVTSLSFDIAGLEIWLPLTVGAYVEIASRETAADGKALRTCVEKGRITFLQATPSTFRLLLAAAWTRTPGLKLLIGGEATPRELADQLLERADSLWNMYGPTETTIWSCVQPLKKSEPVLIGRPIANTQTYVLDRNLSLVPPGVTGELYIGGDGVAHGYLGRPELTAERFVANPFAGGRMYRTGDLCRQRPQGAIEFLGRSDFQVKLRGYRIELGEIEATLAQHPEVREAVVVAYQEGPGDQKLVAYLTLPVDREHSPDEPDAKLFAALRAHLRGKLPEYMVPARFMVLESLPLTANNKIDRKALPAPGRFAAPTTGVAEDPRSAIEIKLLEIWEELLHATGISTKDSFFDVGGDSLLALRLFDRIERSFGVKLPIASLFQAPTIVQLAELLRREGWTPSWSSLVAIQTAGARPPFFLVHAIGGNILNYRLISKYLGNDQPFYGLQARGLSGSEPPHETVEEMATDYISEMRQLQPSGPYRIGGSSSGGVVAYEMAQQLLALGETVATVVMLDTFGAGPPPARIVEALDGSKLRRLRMRLDYHVGNLMRRTPIEGLEYVADLARQRRRGPAAQIAAAMKSQNLALRNVIERNRHAVSSYLPRPYPGRVVMLLSRDEPDRTFYDRRLEWSDLVGEGLTIRFIPGHHDNMLEEPQVEGVAAMIAQCLR